MERHRARAGVAMLTVAALGLLTSIAGVVVGWRLVGQVERTVDDSLVLTADTLDTLDQTITLADEIIASVAGGLESVGATVGTTASSFETTEVFISDLNELTDVLAPGLTDAAATLDDLAATGRTIDGFLDDVSSLPFAPGYDGDLGESLQQLADDIRPLGSAVDRVGTDLEQLRSDAGELRRDLQELRAAVRDVNATLAGSEVLIDQYRSQADDALALAGDARADLDRDVDLTRAFIVAAGIVAALSQIVPLWIGLELRTRSRDEEGDRTELAEREPAAA